MFRTRLVALMLFLVTLAVFIPAVRNGFVPYDDDVYVTANRPVQDGLTWAGCKWAFTSGYACNWHPLTWISHMLDVSLFGMNAGGHHLVSLLFHAANAALVFVWLCRLTGKAGPSLIVAALFAWHPLRVESVAWIAERKDVLSVFFALLSLLCYTCGARENGNAKTAPSFRRQPGCLWLAWLFFILSLMAKPMLVTLPFLLLLLDYWPLKRIGFGPQPWKIPAPLLREKIPFLLASIASCVVTLVVQRTTELSLAELPVKFRLLNATISVARYLQKIFWPANLAVHYPFTLVATGVLVPILLGLILITAGAWLVYRRQPCWLAGWLWFLGSLVPVIGLVPVGNAAMADRYTYLPAIGLTMAVVFGLEALAQNRARWRTTLLAAAVLAIAACVLLTRRQIAFWHDGETLFRHAVAVSPADDRAHNNLGVALEQKGRRNEALAEYREALRLNPWRQEVKFSIGSLLQKSGQYQAALDEYRACLRHDPQIAFLHFAVGGALAALGNFSDATAEYAAALQLQTNYAMPHLGCADIFLAQGRNTEAVAELWTAFRLEPLNYQVLIAIARCLASHQNDSVRDGEKALALALKANELDGSLHPEIPDVAGMAFAETGDFTNAVLCAQTAIELGRALEKSDLTPMQRRLESYTNRKPWRETFCPTNPMENF